MIDERGEILGEICHIKGKTPNSKRFDPTQSEEERHAYDNLILLCSIHHRIIDGDKWTFSVEDLIQMKRGHESNVKPVADVSSNSIRDLLAHYQTLTNEWTEATRLATALARQHLSDSRLEKAGPVLAFLEDQLREMRRWRVWINDRRYVTAILGAQPPILLGSYEEATEQSKRVSPKAYQLMKAASERLRIVDDIIASTRGYLAEDTLRYRGIDKKDEYFETIRTTDSLLSEAVAMLEEAHTLLTSFVALEASGNG